jgi:hypothetical protein
MSESEAVLAGGALPGDEFCGAAGFKGMEEAEEEE